jgi:lysophospholipase L1-like esterase
MVIIYLNRSYAYFYDYLGSHVQDRPAITSLKTFEDQEINRYTFVALGDSLTAGVGTKDIRDTYFYSFTHALRQSEGFIESYNLAYPGHTSNDVLKNQLPKALEKNPDFVTILIGINDIHNLVPQQKFKDNVLNIISQLKAKTHAKITVISIPYLGSNKILFPPYNFLLDAKTRQFNDILAGISRSENLQYLDLYSKTKENFIKSSDLYSSDQFHPSAKGYQLWGQLIHEN